LISASAKTGGAEASKTESSVIPQKKGDPVVVDRDEHPRPDTTIEALARLKGVVRPDGSDASKANGFAKRLIDDDKVDILVGGTTTGSTMSMVPLVEKAGIPFISLAGAVVIVEPVKKWVFKTPHTDRMAAEKVFEDMKKRGIALPLYHAHGVASEEFIKLAGDAAEGVRLPAAALLVADKLDARDAQKPVAMGYKMAFNDKWKADVSTFGGHAYDGLMLAVDALKRAGGTDKAKVRDAIESTKGYVGTGGVVNMSATDHMGLDLSAFRMLEIRKGDWTLVQ
jgi:ABC-type branched-subunit amino acid transport system substrate-binding protein